MKKAAFLFTVAIGLLPSTGCDVVDEYDLRLAGGHSVSTKGLRGCLDAFNGHLKREDMVSAEGYCVPKNADSQPFRIVSFEIKGGKIGHTSRRVSREDLPLWALEPGGRGRGS